MNKTFYILLLFLTFAVSSTMFSQDDENDNGLSRKYKSKRAMRLAEKLTKDKDGDSAKVDAIFLFVTGKLRYDVKRFLRNDTRRMKTNKILRRKKGVCTAYSQLFNELCFHAGIKSVEVEGYSKSLFTDVDDNFYYTDHAWNSVLINDRWELIDLTWCSGYISFAPRQTVWQKFVKAITFGKINKKKTRPYFVRKASRKYFMPDPSVFAITHLPLNPIWQQLRDPISRPDFERDSSFYYLAYRWHYDKYRKPLGKKQINPIVKIKQDEYYTLSSNNRTIKDGDAGNDFNIVNSYCKAEAEYAKAIIKYKKTGATTGKPSLNPNDYITVMENCDNAIYHTNCHAGELSINHKHLNANNNLKKKIVSSENAPLIKQTRNLFSGFRKYHKSFERTANKIESGRFFSSKSYLDKIQESNSKLRDKKAYNRIEFADAKKRNALVIKNQKHVCFDNYKELTDSLISMKKDCEHALQEFQFNCLIKTQRTNKYLLRNSTVAEKSANILYLRLCFYDALDYEIQYPRGKYILAKNKNDSSLYDNKELFPKAMLEDVKNLQRKYEKTQRMEAKLLKEITKIKKKSYYNIVVDSVFQQWSDAAKKFYNYQDSLMLIHRDALDIFANKFEDIKDANKVELDKLKYELKLESRLFRFRKNYINNKYKSRKRLNTHLSKSAKNLQKKGKASKKNAEKASKNK